MPLRRALFDGLASSRDPAGRRPDFYAPLRGIETRRYCIKRIAVPRSRSGTEGLGEGVGMNSRRLFGALVVATALSFGLAQDVRSAGQPLRVCASGCEFSDLASALDAASDGARIHIAAGTFTGGVQIDNDVTLHGAGADRTIIEGGPLLDETQPRLGTGPVVTVSEGTRTVIQGVTLTDGHPEHFGGGIYNAGSLTVRNSVIRDNHAGTERDGHGGGIYNTSSGDLKIIETTISGNTAFELGGEGGGISNLGTATVIDSIITENQAWYAGPINNLGTMTLRGTTVTRNGGFGLITVGIENSGTLSVYDSIISDNAPLAGLLLGFGGGIANRGTAVLHDATVRGNYAFSGGGIVNWGTLALADSVITGTTASVGGGIYNVIGVGTYRLRDSTISGNTGGDIHEGGEPCNGLFCP